ncbi:MAG: hypothetical protein Kow0062_26650 [Acidobacteriota bacterium]
MTSADSGWNGVRVVALGGGTGLPVVLRGLKAELFRGGGPVDRSRLTAVVTVTDDGGSSGRLRRELDMLPPGDIRNCLVALSHERPLVARLFQARYRAGETLEGHSCGNLVLAALAQEEGGSFLDAIEVASAVLNVRGRVLPLTLEPCRLVARLADGAELAGESAIAGRGGRIERLRVDPPDIPPTPGVVEAIESADIVVLGPGSLFSSLVPNVLVPEVVGALGRTRAFRVLVLNAMTEQGETGGLTAAGHARAVIEHAGFPVLDAVLVANDAIPAEVIERYRAEGAGRIEPDDPELETLVPMVIRASVLQAGPKVRHDALLTARTILRAHRVWRRRGRIAEPERLRPRRRAVVRGPRR